MNAGFAQRVFRAHLVPQFSNRKTLTTRRSGASTHILKGVDDAKTTEHQFLNLIRTRRTISNFDPRPSEDDGGASIKTAIDRAVECAMTAPNHKLTEPTTYHRILASSSAHKRLLDIVYETTLQSLLANQLSGEMACKSEAKRKRDKWSAIPAFVAVTVDGMDPCQEQDESKSDSDYSTTVPFMGPRNTPQLEDYASACASIQNMLLSAQHWAGLQVDNWSAHPNKSL